MRKTLRFIVITIQFALSCKEHSATTKEDHAQMKSDSVFIQMSRMEQKHAQLPAISDTLAFVSAGSLLPGKTVFINHVKFTLVKQLQDTIYLMTNDSTFSTPEGYRIGTKFRELSNGLRKNLLTEPGWGYYTKSKSGWSLGFCEGVSCTDSPPNGSSQVDWIFKRK